MLERLFGSDGCENHHYGDYEDVDERRFVERRYVWQDGVFKGWVHGDGREEDYHVDSIVIQQRQKRSCLHDGCREEQTKWDDRAHVPLVEVEEQAYGYDEFKERFAPEATDD